ncbi:related to PAF acetylhydrolase family protein [Phialocephala subalpina]|uniref:1-alkyl-2-acetylglycerophosphocholine esterase n=1 Tax=Phialocephala subalpina TaxID=576137 RepID=A0A1L7WYH5_9HELO|nr:related to PAF acetylhydrolase family protein [Phialocephala subalpina]
MRLSNSLLVHPGLAILFATSSLAHSPSQVLLPKPTGKYHVGLSIAELIDSSRTQPFLQDIEPIKLMISVFYPVSHEHHTSPVPYMPPETALIEDNYLSSDIYGLASPNGTFEKVALQLVDGEHLTSKDSCEEEQEYPLIIFMPGEGTTRLFYSQIASTIASKGYTVVTIDAPYDVDVVQYTDGSFAFFNFTLWNSTDQETALAIANLAVETRMGDVSFVLDSLSNKTFAQSLIPNLPSSGLNTTHTAMFGHSLGGVTAYSILEVEDRILGGLNMDGSLVGPGVFGSPNGTSKPFMLMGHAGHNLTSDDPFPVSSWAIAWSELTGWKRDIEVADTGHYDFSDYPIVFEKLGITPTNQTILDKVLIGSMKGERALETVTTYVGAFLDFVIRGKSSDLLDGPVKEFPEVTFNY